MTKPQAGFTIVELLIVIVIIAILAAITIVAFNGVQNRAQLAALQSEWTNAERQIEAFKAINDTYPVSISDCPVPAATNLCLQPTGSNTYVYATYPVSATGPRLSAIPQWSLAVRGADQAYLRSKATFTSLNEFMQYVDLAPIIDTYGIRQYQLDFDIKSANIGTNSNAMVYQQNGSGARYTGPSVNVPVTTDWVRRSLKFTPVSSNTSLTNSWLAFYGTYGTGNILSVSNVVFTVVK